MFKSYDPLPKERKNYIHRCQSYIKIICIKRIISIHLKLIPCDLIVSPLAYFSFHVFHSPYQICLDWYIFSLKMNEIVSTLFIYWAHYLMPLYVDGK